MGILFGKCVKNARLTKKMHMKDLCKKLKISVVFMYRVEKGEVNFPLKRIKKLLSVLDIHPLVAKNAIVLDFESDLCEELIEQGIIDR